MAFLLPIFLITASYLCGRTLQGLFVKLNNQERNTTLTLAKAGETCLIGMFGLLLLWEALVLPAIKLLFSFEVLTQIYSALLLLICAKGAITCSRDMGKYRYTPGPDWLSPAAVLAVLVFILQAVSYFFFYPDTGNDATVETVVTTVSSDLIYENHPYMGSTFVYGITFRGKLVSLPLFYAYLKTISAGRAVTIVYCIAPLMSLLLNYAVYGIWIEQFTEQAKNPTRLKAQCFLILGLLNLSGSFSHDSVFYYLIHKGFRGETIVFGAILPYVLYLCFRIFVHHEYPKLLRLFLALAVTIPIADVQRGLLPCTMCVVIMLLIVLVWQFGKKVKRK